MNPNSTPPSDGGSLTPSDRAFLLSLARRTITRHLQDGGRPEPDSRELSSVLLEQKGCFVTLHQNGELRGCIGNLTGREPLYQGIMDNAINAAVKDPRFNPVTRDEVEKLNLEISVLSVPQPLVFSSPEDLLQKLVPLQDGVILGLGGRQATYLPQVWEQLPDKTAFLSSLCRKAGLFSDDWKNPKLKVETYQAEVFGEEHRLLEHL
jgi:AmmeMemoRadiSam system protein A